VRLKSALLRRGAILVVEGVEVEAVVVINSIELIRFVVEGAEVEVVVVTDSPEYV
jgi:hypothetical protein